MPQSDKSTPYYLCADWRRAVKSAAPPFVRRPDSNEPRRYAKHVRHGDNWLENNGGKTYLSQQLGWFSCFLSLKEVECVILTRLKQSWAGGKTMHHSSTRMTHDFYFFFPSSCSFSRALTAGDRHRDSTLVILTWNTEEVTLSNDPNDPKSTRVSGEKSPLCPDTTFLTQTLVYFYGAALSLGFRHICRVLD